MPHSRAHPLPSPKLLSPLGRVLAGLQLTKETLTIILLGLPLLVARPLLFPAALPGLVLYIFRWLMVLGQMRQRSATVVWLFTLVDELWGIGLYLRAVDVPTARQMHYLYWSYGLGMAFTLAALAEIAYQRLRARARLRALLKTA